MTTPLLGSARIRPPPDQGVCEYARSKSHTCAGGVLIRTVETAHPPSGSLCRIDTKNFKLDKKVQFNASTFADG